MTAAIPQTATSIDFELDGVPMQARATMMSDMPVRYQLASQKRE